jgi:hypothetical protein
MKLLIALLSLFATLTSAQQGVRSYHVDSAQDTAQSSAEAHSKKRRTTAQNMQTLNKDPLIVSKPHKNIFTSHKNAILEKKPKVNDKGKQRLVQKEVFKDPLSISSLWNQQGNVKLTEKVESLVLEKMEHLWDTKLD